MGGTRGPSSQNFEALMYKGDVPNASIRNASRPARHLLGRWGYCVMPICRQTCPMDPSNTKTGPSQCLALQSTWAKLIGMLYRGAMAIQASRCKSHAWQAGHNRHRSIPGKESPNHPKFPVSQEHLPARSGFHNQTDLESLPIQHGQPNTRGSPNPTPPPF